MVRPLTTAIIVTSVLMASGPLVGGTTIIRVTKPNGGPGVGLRVDVCETFKDGDQPIVIDTGTTNGKGELSTGKIPVGRACIHIDVFRKSTKKNNKGKTETGWTPFHHEDCTVGPVINVFPRQNASRLDGLHSYVVVCVPRQTPYGIGWFRELREVDSCGFPVPSEPIDSESPTDDTVPNSHEPPGYGQRLFDSACPIATVPEPELPPTRVRTNSEAHRPLMSQTLPTEPIIPERIRIPFADDPQPRSMPVASDNRSN